MIILSFTSSKLIVDSVHLTTESWIYVFFVLCICVFPMDFFEHIWKLEGKKD